jgi:CspA family cold shock protein
VLPDDFSGMTLGVVQDWDEEKGWGVLDSDATPGGCWAGFELIEAQGYRALSPGERVSFTWLPRPPDLAQQLSYPFRAARVLRDGGLAARSAHPTNQP